MAHLGRSRTAPSGYHGEIPEDVWTVLNRAWSEPFTFSSNFSRKHVHEVALAASIGWISAITPNGLFVSRKWHITQEGLTAMSNEEHFITTPKEPN